MAKTEKIDYSNMNVYQKLSLARLMLGKRSMKKTGFNKGQKFKYYQLEDFVPHIIQINAEIGLSTITTFEEKSCKLTVVNSDNFTECLDFTIYTDGVISKSLSKVNPIQEVGATQTYYRRYLYMLAYDIVENSTVDGEEFSTASHNGGSTNTNSFEEEKAEFINKIISLLNNNSKQEILFSVLEEIGIPLEQIDKITKEQKDVLEQKLKEINLIQK